ncbi:RHS repeat protein, partial [Bacillus sp. RG28]
MKKKLFKYFFLRLLLLVFLFSSLPLNGFAAEEIKTNDADAKDLKVNPVQPEPLKAGELVDQRTENTKVFYNGNGKYTKKIYFEPVNIKKPGDKQFEEISPDLTQDDSNSNIVTTENTAIDTNFLKTMSNGEYANFSYKGHSISLSILQASGEDKPAIDASDVEANYIENTNKIVHKDVFPQIDLQNYTFNQNTKEDLVLHQYNGYHIFKFKIKTELEATTDKEGNIQLLDSDGKKIFELPKPFMSDSNIDEHSGDAVTSNDVTYDIEKTDDGYNLTLNADPKWLSSPDRVFPIYIDPTTSVTDSSDTFVMSAYPTTNYSSTSSKWDAGLGQYILKIGNYDSTTGTCYALLNQPLPNIEGLTVTSATFNAYVTHTYDSSSTGIWLDRITGPWTNSSVTWNTKPNSTNIANATVTKNQWASFDVKSTVQGWQSGTLPNYGFKLHENGNGQTYWKKIVSTSNSDNNPYLAINYTIPTPPTPTGQAYSYGDGTGTGYVDLKWNAIPGATSYKVWIYNGSSYEAFPVGSATSFSTKGKNIWPSANDIASGKYALHHVSTDGGTELPIDPSSLYKNNGNNYPNNKNFWFRISATYPLGDSTTSGPFTPTIPNLNKPAAPTGTSYTYGNGTGYINFNWKAVTGATSYKIWLFNGHEYESLDVGPATSWTTKGKKYWPTDQEIKAGKYNLHLADNKGAELPVDPSSTYANAGTTYASKKNYYIRVSAINNNGETVYSDYFVPTISTLPAPSEPNGRAYTNMEESNSGYVNLQWDKITGATGYKVNIFNGVDYESYDVGDVDNWTTQDKGIWPKPEAIASGRNTLYHPQDKTSTNYGGTELPLDPSKFYANNGTKYAANPNYYFRISAYDKQGETDVYSSLPFKTTLEQPVPFLGKEDYWSFLDVPGGSVNVATGNFVASENDVSINGNGPGISITRTYNSQSKDTGVFGFGWHSNLDMSVKLNGNNAQYVDEDGTLLTFTKNGMEYEAPTGVYLTLKDNGTNFTIEDKSQNIITFDKSSGMTNGKVLKIEDGHNNATTFNYDKTKGILLSITDSSGRNVDINYNGDGLIQSIIQPSDRQIQYEYDNDKLVKVTGTKGEITKYDYNDDGLLTKIHSPNETDNHQISNEIIYNNGKVNSVKDALGQAYKLDYDTANQNLTVTYPDSKKDQYWYNQDANPSKVIQDVGGLNITSITEYQGNNLKTSYDPNDLDGPSPTPTEYNDYYANGNLKNSTSHYGTESYEYNSNNDVTSYKDTEGKTSKTTYDNQDPVSDIDKSNATAGFSKFDQYGNTIESSTDLSAASNLLVNSSFENGTNGWSVVKSNDSGAMNIDSTGAGNLAGDKSIKLSTISTSTNPNQLGYVYAYQNVDNVMGDTNYTISSNIKTNLNEAQAFYNFYFYNASGTKIGSSDGRSVQLKRNQGWTNRQFTFKTPAGTTRIGVFLEVDHYTSTASGDAWFDNVQLEKSEVKSQYNPIENGGFENGLSSWTGTNGQNDTDSFDGNSSLKINRTSSTQATSEYKQTINIGQNSSDNAFDFTLTGMSKSDSIKANGIEDSTKYGLKAVVYYTDGTTQPEYVTFLSGTNDWNRGYKYFKATKPISKIDISTVFGGNYTGTAWFDGIRLLEGNIITSTSYDANGYTKDVQDLAGSKQTFINDNFGNKKSETDAKGITKSYEYDNGNLLNKVILDNGTTINYQYDLSGLMKNKSIITNDKKTQSYDYEYDDNGNQIKTTGPLKDVTSNKYDANGKLQETTLPSGTVVSYTYDGTGRTKTISYNNEVYFEYEYDKNGNITSVQNIKAGTTKTKEYPDKKNRLRTQKEGKSTINWNYPADSDKLSETNFTHGNQTDSTSYTYNGLDQNTIVTNNNKNYLFHYDELGNIQTYLSGNNTSTTYTYNNQNFINSLKVLSNDGTSLLDETYQYDKNGNRTEIDYPNKQNITYTYDSLNQLESETQLDGTKKEYRYDGFGNRTNVIVT